MEVFLAQEQRKKREIKGKVRFRSEIEKLICDFRSNCLSCASLMGELKSRGHRSESKNSLAQVFGPIYISINEACGLFKVSDTG
jgi:hypothetical protein